MSVAEALTALYGDARLALYSPRRPYLYAHLGDLGGNDLLYYPGAANDLRYRIPLGDVDAAAPDGLITRSAAFIFIFTGGRSLTQWQYLLGYRGMFSMLRLDDGSVLDGLIGLRPYRQ